MSNGEVTVEVLDRWFRAHPRGLGESYWQHGRTAVRIGGQLIGAGAACIVHAVVPSLCATRASRTIHRLHAQVTKRTGRPPTSDNWLDYEI